MERTALIILNYNSFDNIKKILNLANEYLDKEILKIVVDNASNSNEISRLEKLKEHLQYVLIEKEKNTGYADGNNIGIEYAMKKGCKYICILNCDVTFNTNFLRICTKYLSKHNNIAFVGPAILNMDNHLVQSTGGMINLFTGNVGVLNSGKNPRTLNREIECDYLSGACLVFKTDLIDKIGLIPTNYFLFFEETEWCYSAKKKNYKNICLTNLSVYHEGSESINKVDGLHNYLMERNRVVFEKRNTERKYKYSCFLIYTLSKAIFNILKGKKEYMRFIKYYIDGLFAKTSKKYSFIIIDDIKENVRVIEQNGVSYNEYWKN